MDKAAAAAAAEKKKAKAGKKKKKKEKDTSTGKSKTKHQDPEGGKGDSQSDHEMIQQLLANPTLRWEHACADPEAERVRIAAYKEQRRLRYEQQRRVVLDQINEQQHLLLDPAQATLLQPPVTLAASSSGAGVGAGTAGGAQLPLPTFASSPPPSSSLHPASSTPPSSIGSVGIVPTSSSFAPHPPRTSLLGLERRGSDRLSTDRLYGEREATLSTGTSYSPGSFSDAVSSAAASSLAHPHPSCATSASGGGGGGGVHTSYSSTSPAPVFTSSHRPKSGSPPITTFSQAPPQYQHQHQQHYQHQQNPSATHTRHLASPLTTLPLGSLPPSELGTSPSHPLPPVGYSTRASQP